MHRALATLTLAFSWACSWAYPSAAQALDAELLRSVEAVVEREMEAQALVGMSVAVGVDGELAWTAGFGLADLEHRVPATEHTVYRLASVSKPITAAAVMQLVERGEVDLDAPVTTYVPGWPEKRWPVSVRQLLCHQGGVRHYVDGEPLQSTRAYATATEALVRFADDPLIAEPGTTYRYSSYGYNLLGAVVEGASGTSFVDFVNRNVLPAAGTRSVQDDAQARVIPHRARGYRMVDGEVRNARLVDTSYKTPAGGLCGTAADLVRFAHAMQAGRIVEPGTRDLMWTPLTTDAGEETGYGLGWSVKVVEGSRIVRHGGAQTGARTSLVCFVDDGVVVAVTCNSEWCNPPRVAVPIARLLVRTGR